MKPTRGASTVDQAPYSPGLGLSFLGVWGVWGLGLSFWGVWGVWGLGLSSGGFGVLLGVWSLGLSFWGWGFGV